MDPFFKYYVASWSAACLIALGLLLRNPSASSVIYLAAGLFWNLEWQPGRGVIFSFVRDNWPSRPAESAFFRLLGYAAIFALPAIAAVLMFLL